jgi:hypothetical protein
MRKNVFTTSRPEHGTIHHADVGVVQAVDSSARIAAIAVVRVQSEFKAGIVRPTAYRAKIRATGELVVVSPIIGSYMKELEKEETIMEHVTANTVECLESGVLLALHTSIESETHSVSAHAVCCRRALMLACKVPKLLPSANIVTYRGPYINAITSGASYESTAVTVSTAPATVTAAACEANEPWDTLQVMAESDSHIDARVLL